MRILIIRNFPTYMSVTKNTYNIQEIGLAKALVRIGNHCDVVFWTDCKEEDIDYKFDNDKCVKVFYRKGRTALKNTFLRVDDLIPNYDIIQVCEYNQMQSWYFSKKYSKKIVIYHGPYYSEFNKRYNLMCKFFDLLFVKRYKKINTRFIAKSILAEEFLRKKGINNVSTVGVGLDSQMLSDDSEECNETIYKEMIDDKQNIKLLYIGRIEERRNIRFIIDILERVSKRINAHLYIIGDGEENYVNEINEYISDKKLLSNVSWQKRIEQKYMSCIYRNADFFLLPTQYEIFGMVLLEAMFYEECVLTTFNGGSSTIIKNGSNGYVLENNNAEAWSNVIIELTHQKEKRSDVCLNAKATIENEYTWDRLAVKFNDIYLELLNS